MSAHQEVTYTVEFGVRRRRGRESQAARRPSEPAERSIPRIARLLALAIRLEGLIREQTIPNYAAVARRGCRSFQSSCRELVPRSHRPL